MADAKGKGLAILLGLGKPKGEPGPEEAEGEDSNDQELTDAGDELIAAISEKDGLGVATAILNLIEIGR